MPTPGSCLIGRGAQAIYTQAIAASAGKVHTSMVRPSEAVKAKRRRPLLDISVRCSFFQAITKSVDGKHGSEN